MSVSCPVCSQDFDDVEGVRGHLSAAHGVAVPGRTDGPAPADQTVPTRVDQVAPGDQPAPGAGEPLAVTPPAVPPDPIATPAAAPTDPAAANPDAGWHPDPWDPSGLRWWDGAAWTGHTSPSPAPEPEPAEGPAAPAIEPPPAPERPSARRPMLFTTLEPPERTPEPPPGPEPVPRLRPFGIPVTTPQAIAVGAGIVAVLVILAVVFTTHPSQSTRQAVATATSTIPPVPTTAPSAHAVGLADGVLTPADIGGGWTAQTKPQALTSSIYTRGPCASPLWAHDVAGELTQLVNGGGGVIKSGEVDSQVLEAASEADANTQAAFVTSPSYVSCVKSEVVASVQSAVADSSNTIQLGQVSVDPLNVDLTGTHTGYVFTVGLIAPQLGEGVYVTDDHVDLFNGRYEGSVDVLSASVNALPNDLIQTEASRMAERLAALPPGGTLKAGTV